MRALMLGRLRTLGQDLLGGLVELLLPAVCAACGAALPPGGRGFCAPCRKGLVAAGPACRRCAATLGPFSTPVGGCLRCRTERLAFEAADRLGEYDGKLRELVLRIKHAPGEALAEHLGRLWAAEAGDRLAAFHASAVVPMPLHWRRRLERGYNQCEVLAEHLARRLGAPLRTRWLRRVRYTPFQATRPTTERPANVAGVFRVRRNAAVRGESVLLVDDVLTTGATASEAASVLRKAGAARVFVAVLARAD